MEKTGILKVFSHISRLENWRRLAREGADSPLGAATDFLANKGLDDGNSIKVMGTLGSLNDGTAVCFITDAILVSAGLKKAVAKTSGKAARATKKRRAKKAADGSRRADAKRTTERKSVQKGGAKKSVADKKSVVKKKPAGKGSAKKSTGK